MFGEREVKVLREHADDHVRFGGREPWRLQGDRLSQDVRVAAELRLPRVVQIIATGGAAGPSSFGENSRPSTGVTPSVRKNPLLTLRPDTRCGPEGVTIMNAARTS